MNQIDVSEIEGHVREKFCKLFEQWDKVNTSLWRR